MTTTTTVPAEAETLPPHAGRTESVAVLPEGTVPTATDIATPPPTAGRRENQEPQAVKVKPVKVKATGRPVAKGPVETVYDGYPATAVQVRGVLGEGLTSAWWMVAGMEGQEVDILELSYTPTGTARPRKVYVYDDDGEGTDKYITHKGASALGHREVKAETLTGGG